MLTSCMDFTWPDINLGVLSLIQFHPKRIKEYRADSASRIYGSIFIQSLVGRVTSFSSQDKVSIRMKT